MRDKFSKRMLQGNKSGKKIQYQLTLSFPSNTQAPARSCAFLSSRQRSNTDTS